jgi:hypothetical protein
MEDDVDRPGLRLARCAQLKAAGELGIHRKSEGCVGECEEEELAAPRDGLECGGGEQPDETLARQIADDDRAPPRGDRNRLDKPPAEASAKDLAYDLKLWKLWHGRAASGGLRLALYPA